MANLTVINSICIVRAPREPWDRADNRESISSLNIKNKNLLTWPIK